jgi:ankyrin repeat protein
MQEGSTPLYHAATQDYSKITRVLLAHGADPNIRNSVRTFYHICNYISMNLIFLHSDDSVG